MGRFLDRIVERISGYTPGGEPETVRDMRREKERHDQVVDDGLATVIVSTRISSIRAAINSTSSSEDEDDEL